MSAIPDGSAQQPRIPWWLPHAVLIGVLAICTLTNLLIIAPFVLIAASIGMRSRMLIVTGVVLILLWLLLLVWAGVIGGSVGGGVTDVTN